MAQRNLTIEEIRKAIDVGFEMTEERRTLIMDSIEAIRTEAYNQGWDDSLSEFDV